MFIELKNSLRLVCTTIGLCVVAYTSLVLVFAMMFAPSQRLGSLLHASNGKVVGSKLVAQAFTQPEYLWPRPSAVQYNGAGAGGSNLSPTNEKIRIRAKEILQKHSLVDGERLTADLATASGSGLDPHITRAGALLQADRIAASRGVSGKDIHQMIESHIENLAKNPFDTHGLVNVLEFNLLLDANYPLVGERR